MTPLFVLLVILAAIIDTFAAYISRVYSEFGKILSHEVQDNLDEWEQKVEPLIGLSREHAALSAAVLQQLTLGFIALGIGAVLFDQVPHAARPTYPEIAQAVLVVVLVVVFCNQLFPFASLHIHKRALGFSTGLAHPFSALVDDADHRSYSVFLFGGVAG